MKRRTFLKGLGGAAAYAAFGSPSQATPVASPYILLVYCSGGWDQTMVFDNKLDSNLANVEPGASLASGAGDIKFIDHASRPSVKAFFETYGANAAIINGLSVGSMVSRYQVRNLLSATPTGKLRPVDWLSFYTAMVNPSLDIPHAVIDAPYIPGDYTAIATRLTSETIKHYGQALAHAEDLGEKGEQALQAFRKSSFEKIYDAAGDSLDGEKYRALYYGYAKDSLIKERLATAQAALGAQGSDSNFVRNGKLAVELFVAGASQTASIQAGTDLAWDTRSNHYARASVLFEDLFHGLNRIFAHAAAKGVNDKMVVMVVSEGGRNPQLNTQNGKGPWAYTSALLWGTGIAGGTTIGLTDAALRGVPLNPIFGSRDGPGTITIDMQNVMAALYVKNNVPYKSILPNTIPLSLLLNAEAAKP